MKFNPKINSLIVSQRTVARPQGTTVQLKVCKLKILFPFKFNKKKKQRLFHSLPVRLQEFKRGLKREYHKLLVNLKEL